jgi:FlaA1/EpsC-like NDP-sugar epimerase/lipopolysaccharide/colanic/teichoic acid biosynthesis glycosyltransferase
MKRLQDILIALFGFIIILPFLPIVFLIIKLNSSGSALVTQEKVGKGNKLICLYRFRSLNGAKQGKLIGSNRHNTLSKLQIKLSTLFRYEAWPLLFNVLKGDLSIVGPKPENPEYVKLYSEAEKQILSVKPGIICPYYEVAPMREKDDKNVGSDKGYYQKHILPAKLKAELEYIKEPAFGKDIRLIFNIMNKYIRNKIYEGIMKNAKTHNYFFPLDVVLIVISYYSAYQLRFELEVPKWEYILFFQCIGIVLLVRIATFYAFSIYKNLWQFVGLSDLLRIITACSVSSIIITVVLFFIGKGEHSRSILLIDWILCISLIGGSRMALRIFSEKVNVERKARKNVLIIGTSEVANMALRMLEINGRWEYKVIGLINNDKAISGKMINGVKVLGEYQDIPDLISVFRVDEVLIAEPELSSEDMKLLLRYCKDSGVRHRIVPAVSDLLNGSVHLSKFRQVQISDLFGRQPVKLDLSAIEAFLQGKRVIVTGAGGSIGSELCRQIAEYAPEVLILVDKNENYLHEIRCELNSEFESLPVICSLTNITNKQKLHTVFAATRPAIAFHAAANKHVPLSEENPEEAIWNNIYGTKTVADAALDFGVQTFLMISTDKAVNPTSIMGVTKRMAEIYIQALSKKQKTAFVTVRFGNVLNSNGSVIPTFRKQIERGGPITITHPQVERFFMSIAEAVQLTLQAATMGKSGEIYVLEMGKAIRIYDLAMDLITEAGLKPFEDIEIKITGLRPGEKMYEELVGRFEESIPTSHESIKILKSNHLPNFDEIQNAILGLLAFDFNGEQGALYQKLKEIVPEYSPLTHQVEPIKSFRMAPHQKVFRETVETVNAIKFAQ